MLNINKQIIEAHAKQLLTNQAEFFDDLDENRKLSKAFLLLGISSYLDVEIEEANSYVTDGGNDGGFDAASIQQVADNQIEVILFQSKYTRDLTKDSNFSSNAIEKSINTVNTIFDPTKQVALNSLSQGKVEEIRSFLKDGYVPFVKFVFLSNGLKWNEEGDRYIKNAFSNNNLVEFLHYSHDDMIKRLTATKSIDGNLELSGRSIKEDFNYKSVIIGKVRVSEIYRLIEQYGDNLLEKNIRGYLGSNDVNDEIRKTLLDDEKKHNFLFYNNGITITCEKYMANFIASENWILKLSDMQIINGGQTCKTIYETIRDHPEKSYDDVYVLVRVYSVMDNEEFIRDITIATNSQNPVNMRDLRANDEKQILLEKGVKLLGYNYKRKSGVDTAGTPIIPSVAAEATLAIWRKQPHYARNRKNEHFTVYYDTIFSNLNAAQMVLGVLIFRYCDARRKSVSPNHEINYMGRFSNHYMAMIMGDQILKDFELAVGSVNNDNFVTLRNHFENNRDKMWEEVELYLRNAVKEQMRTIYHLTDELNHIDGRTISAVFRNTIIRDQYEYSRFRWRRE